MDDVVVDGGRVERCGIGNWSRGRRCTAGLRPRASEVMQSLVPFAKHAMGMIGFCQGFGWNDRLMPAIGVCQGCDWNGWDLTRLIGFC